MTFAGLGRIEATEVKAGDICAIAGIADVTIGETIADPENPEALPLINIEEPTVKMTFMVNYFAVCRKRRRIFNIKQIRARLFKEIETDVALRVAETDDGQMDSFWTRRIALGNFN